MMQKLFISLSLLGMLFTMTQYLIIKSDSISKIELSKKIDYEEDGENDTEDTDSDVLDEIFSHTTAEIDLHAAQHAIRKNLTLYAEHKCLSIYYKIVTPPPEI